MNAPRTLALAAACALLPACSTLRVGADWDPAADFSGLRTYAWREPAAGRAPNDPFLAQRVHDAVDDVLRARGYDRVAAGPDFTVGWFAVVRERVDVTTWDDPWGWHWRRPYWPGWSAHTSVTTYDEGTLVLDVADGRTGAALWRGTATDVLDAGATPAERDARIREAVTKTFANFPPSSR